MFSVFYAILYKMCMNTTVLSHQHTNYKNRRSRLVFLVRKQLLLRKETIMKTVSSLLSPRLCSYPLSLIGHLEDILFVDIETTGFTARNSCLYLIGAIYF